MHQVGEEGRHRKGWAGGVLCVSGEGRAENGLWEEEKWVPAQERQMDRQLCTHAHPHLRLLWHCLPEGAVCFHGDTKLLSRAADPLLLGSVRLKKKPSMLKHKGTWGITKQV